MRKNYGGPAFPLMAQVPEGVLYQEGMTLRDYFAAKAMQGICSIAGIDFGGPDGAAKAAYKIADAMLAERDK